MMNYLKPKLIITAIMLTVLLLSTGCSEELERYSVPLKSSDHGNYHAKRSNQSSSDNDRMKILDAQLASPLPSAPKEITYSYELAKLVSSIPGVADARVFTAGENAYISVVLDNTGQGFFKSKAYSEREDARTRMEDSNLLNDKPRPGDTDDKTPLTNEPSIHNNPFRYYITVNDNSQLSDRFVETVEDAVKAKQPSIKNVYLSANKDFMYYMDEFAQVVWGGDSLEPYKEQFQILIDHQFFNGKIMPNSLKYYRSE